jgi:SAM-dependent methyltransferase
MKNVKYRSACLLCGIVGLSERFRKENWTYVQCGMCGAVFLHPIPDADELRVYYNEAYMVPVEGYARGTKRNAPPILKELKMNLPSMGKLLEVGCSYGFFLDAAKLDGWDVTGIELDSGAAAFAQDKLGLKVFSGTLQGEFSQLEPQYDVIVAFHVIEHVPDPIVFLQLCRKLLRSGGVLILKTPNVASWIAKRTGSYWQWLSPPAHIHLFSPQTLGLVLEKSGFHTEKIGSQRGDARNNLFELACAVWRFAASWRGLAASDNGRKSWSNRWQVNAADAISDVIYFPFGTIIDPWLGQRGLQPELVAIART